MPVYLVQHGLAVSKEENPNRPLTQEGRNHTRTVAEFLARSGSVQIGRIFHSGKRRAAETADILSECLKMGTLPGTATGPDSNDDPAETISWLQQQDQTVMLVGHLPHLPRLASLLLTGDPDRGIIKFVNSGVVCLEEGEGRWVVSWVVTPDVVG